MSDCAAHAIPLLDNVVYALPLAASAGGGTLLVDAGPDVAADDAGADAAAATWDLAVEGLRAAGLAPEGVRVVLVTHGHIDHAGLAGRWAALGARVLAGEADRPALLGGRRWQDARRERRVEELQRHGCPAQVVDLIGAWGRAALPGWRWEPCPEHAVEATPNGATFELAGGGRLRVLAAPGHTPGNLVAFEQAAAGGAGTLYSGDTLLPGTVPTPGLHFPDLDGPRWPSLPPFLASVARLRALPLRRVLPGHGAPVDNPSRLFERFEAHHARRLRRVRAALAAAAEPLTAFEVTRALFPHLPPVRTGQAMTELIGHLDVLTERGEVRPLDGEPLRYRLLQEAGGE